MYLLTIWLGKFIIFVTRLAGNNGVALPGYIIERINKRFLSQALNKLDQGLVIITGTNGKTTTTKMIADVLEMSGVRTLTNKSGSNFVRSIISLVVDKSSLTGSLPFDIAVIEQDEAYAAKLVEQYQPRGVVVLNVMRDQMDRFGEIDTTAKMLQKVAEAAKEFVVLSDHDPRVASLNTSARTEYFDVAPELSKDFPNDDDWHGPSDSVQNREKHSPNVVLAEFGDHEAKYLVGEEALNLNLQATGQHNLLNAAAALSALRLLLPQESVRSLGKKLESVKAAFGRGEELVINGTDLRLQLIKNPASFTQSLKLLDKKSYDTIAVVINDDHADSRDVSWLWDVDFNVIRDQHGGEVITGGTRAADMALRLKYDDIKTNEIISKNTLLIQHLLRSEDKNILLYCTYTAMWHLRKELVKQGHVSFVR